MFTDSASLRLAKGNLSMATFRKTRLGKYWKRICRKTWRLRKQVYWNAFARTPSDRLTVLVFGAQRSGTGMLCDMFDNDGRTRNLSEESCITGANGSRLRWKPIDEVRAMLAKFHEPLIVAKPLVESQNAPELLREVPRSRAIWMYRSYHDVVNSSVAKFRRQVDGIRAVASGDEGNWRSERVSQRTREIVSTHFAEDMPRHDAAALMWYARNILFFELELFRHPKVMLCRYEDLASNPATTARQVYSFLGVDYPGDFVVGHIDVKSIGLGRSVALQSGIAELCDDLQSRLEEHQVLP